MNSIFYLDGEKNPKKTPLSRNKFKKKKLKKITRGEPNFKIYFHNCATVHVQGVRMSSHLSFLLDFEELCHVREIFLVSFCHLLLCSLRVHDLQPLQKETITDLKTNKKTKQNPKLSGRSLVNESASFYLERCECYAGAGSWRTISDCGLSSICHALLLQRPLWTKAKMLEMM